MKMFVRAARNPGGATQDTKPGDRPGGVAAARQSPYFGGFPSGFRGLPLAITASLCLHLLGAVLVSEAIRIASLPEVNVFKQLIAESRVEHLLLRIPSRQPPLLPRIQYVVADAMASQRSRGKRTRRAPAARSVAREMDASRAAAVLLQPHMLSPELTAALDIRSLTVWSGPSPQRTPAPIVAGSVGPVSSTIVAGLTSLLEVPVLAPPTLAVATPLIPSDRAGLTLPAAGSTPLRSEAQLTPPGSTTTGESAAVIAISSLPPVPNEVVVIPPGNYLIVGSGGAPEKPESSPTKAQAAVKAESAKHEPAKSEPASTNTSAETGRTETTSNATMRAVNPSKPASAETAETGRGPSRKAGQAEVQISANRTIPSASGAIQVRGNHDGSLSLTYPRDGQFDIVVIQSGSPEAAGDLSKLLSGKPVHTVFIQVGGPREWVLQYCLPEGSETGARQSGMVVSLGSPAPLRAPFILEAHLPPGVTWNSRIYQVFHGILGPNGKLEQLRAVTANSSPGQLMEYLARWTFRPATSGKETKLVEVLLIIPPDPAA